MVNRRWRSSPARAVAAIERTSVQRMLHGVVRSTATAAPAATPAPVLTRLRAAMRGEVREPAVGEADTAGARSAAAPGRARRAPPARGEHSGAGHGAIEPVLDRVDPTAAASAASRRTSVSAQRPKGAKARGIAAVSSRSGDRSGEPGREATRPNPSHRSAHRSLSSAPGPSPGSVAITCRKVPAQAAQGHAQHMARQVPAAHPGPDQKPAQAHYRPPMRNRRSRRESGLAH